MTSELQALLSTFRSIAAGLRRWASQSSPGALIWDGTAYVPSSPERTVGLWDPYAALWCSKIETIVELLERQSCEPTAAQVAYLRSTFFGGMGSFQDFVLAPERNSREAEETNSRLAVLRERLYQQLNQFPGWPTDQ